MAANSIVDIELADLEPADDHLAEMGFQRLPTWDEVFSAVHSVVEKTDGCLVPIGGATLIISRDSGKCLLYAGVGR